TGVQTCALPISGRCNPGYGPSRGGYEILSIRREEEVPVEGLLHRAVRGASAIPRAPLGALRRAARAPERGARRQGGAAGGRSPKARRSTTSTGCGTTTASRTWSCGSGRSPLGRGLPNCSATWSSITQTLSASDCCRSASIKFERGHHEQHHHHRPRHGGRVMYE